MLFRVSKSPIFSAFKAFSARPQFPSTLTNSLIPKLCFATFQYKKPFHNNHNKHNNPNNYMENFSDSLGEESGLDPAAILNKILKKDQGVNEIENILLLINEKATLPAEEFDNVSKIESILAKLFKHMKQLSIKHSDSRIQKSDVPYFFTSVNTLNAFINLVNMFSSHLAITLTNRMFLQSFTHLMETEKIQIEDFLEILKRIMPSKDKFIKANSIDTKSAGLLSVIIEKFLADREYCTSKNLELVSDFVSNFPSVFQPIRKQFASILKKRCFECLSSLEEDPSQIEDFLTLYPSLLSYHDIEPATTEITNIVLRKVSKQVIEPYLLEFILKTYNRVKEGSNAQLTNLLFSVYNNLLSERSKSEKFNLSTLETGSIANIATIGDLIIENKLAPQALINLLFSQLQPEYTSKIDLTISRVKYLYDFHFTITDETLDADNTLNSWPGNKKPQQITEIITAFFIKLYPFFNIQGLYLMLYLSIKNHATLGKHESLLYASFKRKSTTLKEEEIFEALDFFRTFVTHKKYLRWISSFDQVWIKVLQGSQAHKDNNFIYLTGRRKDLIYQDFRTLDILVDNILMKQMDGAPIKRIAFALNYLASSKLSCSNFYQYALNRFEKEYMALSLNACISFLSKFAYLGVPVKDNVVDYIISRFRACSEDDPCLRHVSTPLKLYCSIVLLGKFKDYDINFYKKIYHNLSHIWDKNYSDIDKE